jgi:multidrug efflux system outer membrane protein
VKGGSKLRYLLLFSFLLTSLYGCAVGPDYEPPEVDSPQDWRIESEEATDIVNTPWWEAFNDPVLNELIETALEENRDVRIAAARVEQFAANLKITRSEFSPQIGYDISGNRNQAALSTLPIGTQQVSENYQATINVGWELDVWGRIRRASEAARSDLLAAEEGRRTVILTLVSSVATSYVTLRSLDRQLEIARETVKIRRESVELFEKQFRGGIIAELTLAQARSEYEQAVAAVPVLERQISQLENALSVLLGRNPGPIQRGRTLAELEFPDIPAALPSDLLVRRPDIRQAEQNLVAANARIGVARAEYFPRISLTGLAGFVSGDLDALFSDESEIWNVSANATGAIFTGGRVSGGVEQAEAIQKQALQSYLQSIQVAFREVNDALVETQKTREEQDAQGRRVEALESYARLARLRFDNGYSSYIEVLDAQRSLFSAQLNYVQSQNGVFVGLINTYKAMGGGWVTEAEAVANEVDYPPPESKTVGEESQGTEAESTTTGS